MKKWQKKNFDIGCDYSLSLNLLIFVSIADISGNAVPQKYFNYLFVPMKKLLLLLLPLAIVCLGGCSNVNCYPNNDESCFIIKCKEVIQTCNNCWYSERIQWWIYIDNCWDYLDRMNWINL